MTDDPSTDRSLDRRQTLIDAGLALAALLVAAGYGVVADIGPRPAAALAGVGTVLAVEGLALRLLAATRYQRIREAWERPGVRAASTLLAAALGGLGVRLAPDPTVSAVVGGLVAYLALVGALLVRHGER